MFHSYKQLVARLLTKYWLWVIVFWIVLAVGLRAIAPSWNSIAQDGDLQFLPKTMESRIGQRWLEDGFPSHRARSQIVVIFARRDSELAAGDLAIGLDVARRLKHSAAVAEFRRWKQMNSNQTAMRLVSSQVPPTPAEPSDVPLTRAKQNLDEAIELDQQWFNLVKKGESQSERLVNNRLAVAYWDRARILALLGDNEHADADRETAQLLLPSVSQTAAMENRTDFLWDDLLETWTWQDEVLGNKLGANNKHAKMLVLQLGTEFIATKNIEIQRSLEQMLNQCRVEMSALESPDLKIGISGSAAVGGDILRAAATSVRQTEWVTVLLILIILTVIYRGPLLVAIPLLTIGLSLVVATSMIALLAKPSPQSTDFGLRVFTTTKIFIVVLLFGAGTDFCLFFLSRCRETIEHHGPVSRRNMHRMVASSWCSVHDALVGSALTTIVGLGLMFFSDFEKFTYSGPIIGLSLAVTILVCLTFTPAVLCGIGSFAFWPSLKAATKSSDPATTSNSSGMVATVPLSDSHIPNNIWNRLWGHIADWTIGYPRITLILCLAVLGIPALQGWYSIGSVTYDFPRELGRNAPSRQGTELVESFFSTRDSSPITVMLNRSEAFADDKSFRDALDQLRLRLYIDGVTSVRTLTDPLGDYPPSRRVGLLAVDTWYRRVLENHRMTHEMYVASNTDDRDHITRMDVMIKPDPFSLEAEEILQRVRDKLSAEMSDRDSPWFQTQYACTGTTAGIHDLKFVTQRDQTRIQILVVLGVWLVLIIVLRRFWISGYLILTVLLSYLTTLGLTHWFFQWTYGVEFVGLDWKVPLFLFVILVAVGQDYNVYLTTRVFEEQATHGPMRGLRRAMILTGGIITSCGVVMAGTFLSMTSGVVSLWLGKLGWPAWLGGNPDALILSGVIELGFALALGVMIDTLLVRSILVPAMFAWLTRWTKQAIAG